jgi:hypothetical protein
MPKKSPPHDGNDATHGSKLSPWAKRVILAALAIIGSAICCAQLVLKKSVAEKPAVSPERTASASAKPEKSLTITQGGAGQIGNNVIGNVESH